MGVQTDSSAEIMDAVKYLKLISPPPEGHEVPWFTAIDRDGFQVLWEAVRRLELIVHRNKTSAEVGGPYLLGDDAIAIKNPPPPPPGWHGAELVSPTHE